MYRSKILLATLLAVTANSVIAEQRDDWIRRILSSGATTATSYTSSRDDRQALAEREDASSFVASAGRIRGPYLEARLQQVRQTHPALQASDMELATAILALSRYAGTE